MDSIPIVAIIGQVPATILELMLFRGNRRSDGIERVRTNFPKYLCCDFRRILVYYIGDSLEVRVYDSIKYFIIVIFIVSILPPSIFRSFGFRDLRF